MSERRRILILLTFAALAVPAVAVAGCASDTRPPRSRSGGGNRGGEKSGGSGGPGSAGSR